MQLYLPPTTAVNKDFLKLVLRDRKDFLELADVRFVTVPLYDELAIGKLWPLMRENAAFMRFFPDAYSKGRLPDRAYFFNVMNTVEGEYLQGLIKHAHEMRNAGADKDQEYAQIKISDAWWEKLNAIPFISSKSIFMPNNRCRDQRAHALASEERLEADGAGAQAPQDTAHVLAGAVPRRAGGAEAGGGRGRPDDGAAEPAALAVPQDADAQEGAEAGGRVT